MESENLLCPFCANALDYIHKIMYFINILEIIL